MFSDTFTISQIHVVCANFVKLADRKSVKLCVAYQIKKNKISARSPALASARIAPKICQGQLRTIYSEYPKLHPNPFTSGGVIAGRVNIVQTRHKCFQYSAKLQLLRRVIMLSNIQSSHVQFS